MSDFEVSVRLRADGRGLVQEVGGARAAVDRLKGATTGAGQAARASARDFDAAGAGVRRMAGEAQGLRQSFVSLRGAIAGLGAAAAVRGAVQIADSFTLASGRIALVAREGQSVSAVMDDLFVRAQRARSEFGAFNQVFFRTARALKDNAALAGEAARFTELLAKSGRISGASAQEQANALIQLSQGLAAGQVRGEELRSVMEQLPDIISRVAAGLGIDFAEVVERSFEGQISAQQFVEAFLSQAEQIEQEFGSLPRTVGEAMVQLRNEIAKSFGEQAAAAGATDGLTAAIDRLRGSVADVVPALVSITSGIANMAASATENSEVLGIVGSIIIARIAGPAVAGFGRAAAAQVQFTDALLTGRAVAIDSARATELRAAALLRAAQAEAQERAARVANIRASVEQLRATVALAAAQRAELATQVELARGIAAATGRRTVQAAAERDLARSMAGGLAARAALAKAEQSLAAAETAGAAATARASAAQTAHSAALARTGIAARAAAASMGILRGAMTFLGGPVGVAITAIAAGMLLFGRNTDEAARASNTQLEASRQLRDELERQGRTVQQATRDTIADTNERLTNARATREQTRAALDKALAEAEIAAAARQKAERRDTGGVLGVSGAVVSAQVRDIGATAEVDRLKNKLAELDETIANDVKNIDDLNKILKGGGQSGGGSTTTSDELDKLTRKLEDFAASADPAAARALELARALSEIDKAAEKGVDPALVESARAAVQNALKPITGADVLAEAENSLARQQRLIALTNRDRAVAEELERRRADAIKDGVTLSADQAARLAEIVALEIDAAASAEQRNEANRRAAEEFNRIFETARENVQRALADSFDDLLGGQIKGVRSFWKEFQAIGRRTIAETLAALVFSGGNVPAGSGLSPIASTIAGLFRRQQGGGASSEGAGSVAAPLAGVSEALAPITKGFRDTFKPLFEKFGGSISDALGKGLSGAAVGGAVAGIGQALGLKLSGGGAAVGGALGSATGIPGGSLAGGLVGGTVGKLPPAALAALGTIAAGPLGGLAAFALGGGFAKTPVSSAELGTGGLGAVSSRGKADDKVASDLAGGVLGALSQIAAALGADLASSLSLGQIGQRKDDFIFSPTVTGRLKDFGKKGRDPDFQSFATAEEAAAAAIRSALSQGAVEGLSEAVKRALGSSSDIDKAVAAALKVRDLELLVEGVTDPFRAAFRDFERQAKDRLDTARQFGFDVLEIEKINADQRKQLIEAQLEGATGSVRRLLDDLAFGNQAEGSLADRRAALLAEQQRLAAQAASGDTSVLDRLAQISAQLIDVSKEAFGSTGAFAADRGSTTGLLQQLLSETEARIRQSSDAAQASAGTDKTAEQLSEANQSLDDLVLAQQRAINELRAINSSLSGLGGGSGALVGLGAAQRLSVQAF